jgi:acetyltransferase
VVLNLASRAGLPERELTGVQLKAFDAESVRRAFNTLKLVAWEYLAEKLDFRVKVQPLVRHQGHEIALRSTTQVGMGPVLQFGMGGRWATLAPDRVLAQPPLSPRMIRRVIEKSYLFTALRAMQDREPVNTDALQQFLTCFSRLVVEQPTIKELTINPLLVTADRVLALDALVLLHDPETQEKCLPKLVMGRDQATARG